MGARVRKIHFTLHTLHKYNSESANNYFSTCLHLNWRDVRLLQLYKFGCANTHTACEDPGQYTQAKRRLCCKVLMFFFYFRAFSLCGVASSFHFVFSTFFSYFVCSLLGLSSSLALAQSLLHFELRCGQYFFVRFSHSHRSTAIFIASFLPRNTKKKKQKRIDTSFRGHLELVAREQEQALAVLHCSNLSTMTAREWEPATYFGFDKNCVHFFFAYLAWRRPKQIEIIGRLFRCCHVCIAEYSKSDLNLAQIEMLIGAYSTSYCFFDNHLFRIEIIFLPSSSSQSYGTTAK